MAETTKQMHERDMTDTRTGRTLSPEEWEEYQALKAENERLREQWAKARGSHVIDGCACRFGDDDEPIGECNYHKEMRELAGLAPELTRALEIAVAAWISALHRAGQIPEGADPAAFHEPILNAICDVLARAKEIMKDDR